MSTITARRVTAADVPNLTVGQQVYRVHETGKVDKAEIIRLDVRDVFARSAKGYQTKDVIGTHTSITARTVYGAEQAAPRLFDSMEAFDAHYPADGSNGSPEAILARLEQFPLLIEDPNGEEFEVQGDWGSMLSLTIAVPGMDAETLQAAVTEILSAEFPGAEIPKEWARPVANRRVNVSVTGDYVDGKVQRKIVAMNVLQALAGFYVNASSYYLEYVDENVKVG